MQEAGLTQGVGAAAHRLICSRLVVGGVECTRLREGEGVGGDGGAAAGGVGGFQCEVPVLWST